MGVSNILPRHFVNFYKTNNKHIIENYELELKHI